MIKHFYYDNDKNVYQTQLEALASNKNCWFYFNDLEFSKLNWKVEPTESLDELYVLRAQELRDKYDYLILCYSGGTDSTHVLETFYYNNIHIDEIVTVGALSQDEGNGSGENMNSEIYENVLPTLNELHLPKTKITVVDFSKLYENMEQFSLVQKYGIDWPRHIGPYRSPYGLFWYDIKKIIGKDNNKKTAVIMGSDKCKLTFNYGDPAVYFKDLPFCSLGGFLKDENYERVNFYTDYTEIPFKILTKQAHLMLKIYDIDPKLCLHIQNEHEFAKIFYKYRKPPNLYNDKSKYTIISGKDRFLLHKTNSDVGKLLGMSFSMFESLGISTKVKHEFHSKPYFLR